MLESLLNNIRSELMSSHYLSALFEYMEMGHTILEMTSESGNNSRSIFGRSRSNHTLDHVICHQTTIQVEEEEGLTSKRIIGEPDDIPVHLLE